jgi:hypothetical protein
LHALIHAIVDVTRLQAALDREAVIVNRRSAAITSRDVLGC